MKIAIVTTFFPPNAVGGAELSSYNLAKTLSIKGNEVHIIAPDFGNRAECTFFEKDNPDLHIHYMRYPFHFTDVLSMRLLAYNPLYILMLTFLISTVVKKHDIDVVHAHQNEDSIPSWLASRITGKPIIVNLYDLRFVCEQNLCAEEGEIKLKCNFMDYMSCNLKSSKKFKFKLIYLFGNFYMYIYMKINQVMLKKSDSIISISQFLKNLAIQSGYSKKRIKVIFQIPCSDLDIENVNLDFKGYKIITYAGRLDPYKGVQVLIESFSEVIKEIPSKLLIIGDTNNKHYIYLKELTEKFDLEKDIIFLGKLSNKKTIGIFKISDAVIVPSIWPEPQGRTVLESLYVKTPVVASNVGGIPELIDKNSGILVKPNDEFALTDSIIEILKNGKERYSPDIKKLADKESIYLQTIEVYQKAILER